MNIHLVRRSTDMDGVLGLVHDHYWPPSPR